MTDDEYVRSSTGKLQGPWAKIVIPTASENRRPRLCTISYPVNIFIFYIFIIHHTISGRLLTVYMIPQNGLSLPKFPRRFSSLYVRGIPTNSIWISLSTAFKFSFKVRRCSYVLIYIRGLILQTVLCSFLSFQTYLQTLNNLFNFQNIFQCNVGFTYDVFHSLL